MKLYRSTRGPYKTSKFGKLVSESRDGLLSVLRSDANHPILDPWIAGMARDTESPFGESSAASDSSGFDRKRAVEELKSQKGYLFLLSFSDLGSGFRIES